METSALDTITKYLRITWRSLYRVVVVSLAATLLSLIFPAGTNAFHFAAGSAYMLWMFLKEDTE